MNDPEVNVICETMGGIHPAYEFSKRALLLGKSVCTSNKELVANHGPELLRLARENKCNYLFEASVGGGIPIIRPINYSLTAEKIDGITGILNGTTNYILSKMASEGADFEDVLEEAQEPAEADAAAGEVVTLVVRPECIRLAGPDEAVTGGAVLDGMIA